MKQALAAIVAAVLMLGTLASAAAEERQLSGAEIDAWLRGNTVVGVWAGADYRQYFSAAGWPDYAQVGVPVDRGRWWVTEDRYCSFWQGSGDACYRVLRDGDTLIWVTNGLVRRTFTAEVVPGNQLAN